MLPPSARSTVQLTVSLALFNRLRLNRELQAGDARGTAGLAARFEFPVVPNLALGLVVELKHWEGVMGRDELLVSPSDFADVQLWARPRWLLGDLELSLPLGIGPSLMEELDASDTSYYLAHQDEITDEDAYPPELGLTASAQLEALYWFNGEVGMLLELGVEYHHATGREHDGLPLTLDLVQPKAAVGVAFAF